MRICAQTLFNDPDKRGTFSSQEKTYYTSAVEHYQKSLGALGERKSCAEVWDRVTWELSGTHYTMGTLIQDYFSAQESEAEKVGLQTSLFTSCWQVVFATCVCIGCSSLLEQVRNKLLTASNKLDGTIRLAKSFVPTKVMQS